MPWPLRTESPFEAGECVRTPTGALAKIIMVYPQEGEALVEWPNGDEARFTFANLRALP
jgi:hypothetical protein